MLLDKIKSSKLKKKNLNKKKIKKIIIFFLKAELCEVGFSIFNKNIAKLLITSITTSLILVFLTIW